MCSKDHKVNIKNTKRFIKNWKLLLKELPMLWIIVGIEILCIVLMMIYKIQR